MTSTYSEPTHVRRAGREIALYVLPNLFYGGGGGENGYGVPTEQTNKHIFTGRHSRPAAEVCTHHRALHECAIITNSL
jgi:hypothetical protein